MSPLTRDYIYHKEDNDVPAVLELVSANHPDGRRRYPSKIAGMIMDQVDTHRRNVKTAERYLKEAREDLSQAQAKLKVMEEHAELMHTEAIRFARLLPDSSKVAQAAAEEHVELTQKEEERLAAIEARQKEINDA
tara:strand:- start:26237 stop:26641 length:405 start_codon:yes stop_codon:yes gene_type:complete